MTPKYKVLPQFRRPPPVQGISATYTSFTEGLTVGNSLFAVLGVAPVREEVLMSLSGFFNIHQSRWPGEIC